MKKKMMCVFATGVFLFVTLGIAEAHDYYAPYKNNSVLDGNGEPVIHVPSPAINDDGTIDCCFCHYDLKAPNAPGYINCAEPGETGVGKK
ncbi:MAG: hypothetical protein V1706_06335 [Pseudomonadota bacterium]